MDFNNINQLLEKYWEGESSLIEEETLKQYFNNGSIAPEHLQFQPLFQFFKEEQDVMISDDFEKRLFEKINNEPEVKVRKINWMRSIRSIAAVGVILFGSFFVFQKMNTASENPYEGRKANIIALVDASDEAEAIEETKAALKLLSRKMKKGSDKANAGFSKIKTINKNPLK